jgi:hypothetical protein
MMNMTSTLPIPQSCDAPTQLLMAAMCLVGIVVCFAGYRLYLLALGLFGFVMAATVQAVNGFSWIARVEAEDQERIIKQVIVVLFCLLWGSIGAVLCMKISEKLQKFLGFILGAAGGVALVGALIYLLKGPVSDGLGDGYEGWEGYAFFSLAPPVALLTGWFTKDLIKRLLMLVTALLGAVVAVCSAESILQCLKVEVSAAPPVAQVGIIAAFGLLGFGIQVCTEPATSARKASVGKPQEA